ncbi:MAG: HAMP domain-containing sensor histidine kinase [Litorimonas sp.]
MIDGFISRRLSSKLLLLTIGFVMLAEMVIFVPSAALFRQDWLTERSQQAGLLAQALTGVPDYEASEILTEQFMTDTDVLQMAAKRDGMTELILGDQPEDVGEIVVIDMRVPPRFPSLLAPFQDFFSNSHQTLLVKAMSPVPGQDSLDLLIPRSALRMELIDYLKRIFWLSLIIAIITGSLIYWSMSAMIIRPVKRLAEDMTAFRENPEHRRAKRVRPKRKDEIGQLEREFIDMKQSQRAAFRQRERLAGLGLAVAKINHDLRNVLTSALLISDRLSMNPEQKLSDMGERLTRTVERGIGLTEDVMSYSRAETADPQIQDTRIAFTIGEAAADVIEQFPKTQFRNTVPTDLMVRTDPDHAYRIFHNLFRNAAQAMAAHCEKNCRLQVGAEIRDGLAELRISDTGPGLPDRAKENLFQAFSSAQAHSANTKSTGLGLSISKELAKAQGGDLNLMSSDDTGTRFVLTLPLSE